MDLDLAPEDERFRAHGGAGDDSRTGYRAEAERAAWEVVCPVRLYEGYLRRQHLLDDTIIDGLKQRIDAEIAGAFEYALASPNPTEDDLARHVYAD